MDVFVKVVIFSIEGDSLKTFLQTITSRVFGLPSRQISLDTSFENTALALSENALGVRKFQNIYIEQLYTIGGKSISITYYLLLPWGTESKNSKRGLWFPVNSLPSSILLEEKKILEYTIVRLRWKIEYTNAAYSLLPSEFTLTQLQNVYEIILGRVLDKRNFRKRILSLGILQPLGKKRKMGKARPAAVYVFKDRKLTYVNII